MKVVYLVIFSMFFFAQESDEHKLVGEWNLKHDDAIQKIKSSPRYQLSDPKARATMDKQFEEMLEKGGWFFSKDTLDYADLEGMQVRYRVGLWRMKDKTLYITDINRPFSRRAHIHFLSADSLVLSHFIGDVVSDSKMVFIKRREPIAGQ